MNVMASGLGSRHRAKLALKNQTTPKSHEEMALTTVVQSTDEIIEAKPLAISRGPVRVDGSKKAMTRLYSLLKSWPIMYRVVIPIKEIK